MTKTKRRALPIGSYFRLFNKNHIYNITLITRDGLIKGDKDYNYAKLFPKKEENYQQVKS